MNAAEQGGPAVAELRSAPGPLARQGRYGDDAGLLAVAHRGGAGLGPENTLAAFARACALGVRHLETDVRITADGVCVAFHDARTDRLCGVPGSIRQLDWPQVRRLRVHGCHPVPRLEDVLRAFPDARFLLDVKDPRAIGSLAAAVRGCAAEDRVCVTGSSDDRLADVRAVSGERIATALGWGSLARLTTAAHLGIRPRGIRPAPFAHVPAAAMRVPPVARRLVTMAHDLGSKVVAWTVNDTPMMHDLLDAGVDGLISDRPDLARDVLIHRGQWRR